ncbi:hypothetical protein [Jidongwangia harbinensis]|uniref:hypothetical protein n=1 Tax=Jidongwangia harbinensis TaxID=2878561 RepID=UPI001CD95437|nr:hypothetical protein [Jidongwangia harbinensis]MCA2219594.1 hypothetical protein [Jidongwangia harbinensis]
MTVGAKLDKPLDRKYEQQDLHTLIDAAVDALAGVCRRSSPRERPFTIQTIGAWAIASTSAPPARSPTWPTASK